MNLCGEKKIPDVKEQLIESINNVGLSMVTTHKYRW